ncbi:MAG: hypothetical protein II649_09845, partial [Kiritimatiellae bacterium]|nr:hypothetical protein [Kiritimatiellia bacterium]
VRTISCFAAHQSTKRCAPYLPQLGHFRSARETAVSNATTSYFTFTCRKNKIGDCFAALLEIDLPLHLGYGHDRARPSRCA